VKCQDIREIAVVEELLVMPRQEDAVMDDDDQLRKAARGFLYQRFPPEVMTKPIQVGGGVGGRVKDAELVSFMRECDRRFNRHNGRYIESVKGAVKERRLAHAKQLAGDLGVPPMANVSIREWLLSRECPAESLERTEAAASSSSTPYSARKVQRSPLGGPKSWTEEQIGLMQFIHHESGIGAGKLPLAGVGFGLYWTGKVPEPRELPSPYTTRYGSIRVNHIYRGNLQRRLLFTLENAHHTCINVAFDGTGRGFNKEQSLFLRVPLLDENDVTALPEVVCLFIDLIRVADAKAESQAQRSWKAIRAWCEIGGPGTGARLYLLIVIHYTSATVDHAALAEARKVAQRALAILKEVADEMVYDMPVENLDQIVDGLIRTNVGGAWGLDHLITIETGDVFHSSCLVLTKAGAAGPGSHTRGSKGCDVHTPHQTLHDLDYIARKEQGNFDAVTKSFMGHGVPHIPTIKKARWETIPKAGAWALDATKMESKIHPGHCYLPSFYDSLMQASPPSHWKFQVSSRIAAGSADPIWIVSWQYEPELHEVSWKEMNRLARVAAKDKSRVQG
jgi:hypothetical protein